jgi:hypothetical protein
LLRDRLNVIPVTDAQMRHEMKIARECTPLADISSEAFPPDFLVNSAATNAAKHILRVLSVVFDKLAALKLASLVTLHDYSSLRVSSLLWVQGRAPRDKLDELLDMHETGEEAASVPTLPEIRSAFERIAKTATPGNPAPSWRQLRAVLLEVFLLFPVKRFLAPQGRMDVEDKEALLHALAEQRAEPPAVRVGYQNSAPRRDAASAPRRETRASKPDVTVQKIPDLLAEAAKLPSLFDLVKKQPHLAYAVQLSAALSLGDEDQDVPSQTIVPQPRPDAPTILTASTLAYFFQFALAKCGINIDNGAESSSEDDVMHHDDSAPPEDDKAGKDSVVLRGKAKKQRDKGAVIQRSAQDRWIGAAQARRKIYHASSEPAAEEDDQVQPMQVDGKEPLLTDGPVQQPVLLVQVDGKDAPLPGQQPVQDEVQAPLPRRDSFLEDWERIADDAAATTRRLKACLTALRAISPSRHGRH